MRTYILLLIGFFTLNLSAENRYLQIIQGDVNVKYPPNTIFELYENGKLLYTQETIPEKLEINSPYKLVLYPSWKDTEDIYNLNSAELIMHPTKYEWLSTKDKIAKPENNASAQTSTSAVVMAEKTIIKSLTNPKAYNLILKFNNGLNFYYTDGEAKATLNEQKVKIQGSHYIETEIGIYKISFRPSNAETWWVFEPKK